MVQFITVYNKDGLQNVMLVQHRSRADFKADWEMAIKAQNALNAKMHHTGKTVTDKAIGPHWSIFSVYRILEDMGWSITSLHCTEVSY